MTESFQRRRNVWMCLGLAAAVGAVYWPVVGHEFINFDDPVYVTDNFHVQQGLTGKSVWWAFTTLEAQFWHPLTWVSHMVDWEFYGAEAGGHHLTNLLLHLASTLVLFAVLQRMTGGYWRSGLVAALFALHPLHVESVAWVAERKDVLSTLFWMLTLWAYVGYVERCEGRGAKSAAAGSCELHPALRLPPLWSRVTRRPSLFYGLALLLFVLGLMSKPMVVTLPFVLLLLDFWPLKRLVASPFPGKRSLNYHPRTAALTSLIKEKIPFLTLAVVVGGVALLAHARGGGVTSLSLLSSGDRIANALVSCVRYLQKTVWPDSLAVYYPHPGAWPLWLAIGAALFLLILTVAVIRRTRVEPWLGVGWLWYLGTLVPVMGLVQVGSHAMADRYTYVPLIGIFVMVVWGANEWFVRWNCPKSLLVLVGGLMVAGCMVVTCFQVKYWRNSEALFRRALAVTGGNHLVHGGLGTALLELGLLPEAVGHLEQALALKPEDAVLRNNLGAALFRLGRVPEAVAQYEQALRLNPDDANLCYNLGKALVQLGKVQEGIEYLQQVTRLKPGFANAHFNLGTALWQQGRFPEAVAAYEEALRLKPDYINAHFNLGTALWQLSRLPEATAHYEQGLRLKPGDAEAHSQLGHLLALQGQIEKAVAHYREAVRITPQFTEAHYALAAALAQQKIMDQAVVHFRSVLNINGNHAAAANDLAWILATETNRAIRNVNEAVQWARRACELTTNQVAGFLDTLGVACSEAGRFPEAVEAAERALARARAEGDDTAAARIKNRLEHYRTGQACHTISGETEP